MSIVFLDGKYVSLRHARISILDRGFNYGDGIFETMRAYGGGIFRLEDHMRRLWRAARAISLRIPYTRRELAQIAQETVAKNRLRDAYVRLTVTRGGGMPPLLAIDPATAPSLVILALPARVLPGGYYANGVKIVLAGDAAARIGGLREKIKSCGMLPAVMAKDYAARHGAFETIFLDGKGYIAEGAVSNIFLVKNGALITPALNPWILPGITRQVILDLARKLRIPAREEAVKASGLLRADEIFLTNTGIEILPVTRIDKTPAGGGKPGVVTLRLRQAFSRMRDRAQAR